MARRHSTFAGVAVSAILWASLVHAEAPPIPSAMRSCMACHQAIVTEYLESHGMARSLGPAGKVAPGTVVNPRSGTRYQMTRDGWLEATFADGGRRTQRLVGRIGAGIFDVSWVGAEVDVITGEDTGRLFFAPVETVTGHGLELSPFELADPAPGLDMALTKDCLTCHTDSGLTQLTYPDNAFADGAFDRLAAIGCDGCHGDATLHLEIVAGQMETLPGELGLTRLAELTPGARRDVCARCHLQGDARFELTGDSAPEPGSSRPLAGRIPVLVPAVTRAGSVRDDFRFVSQTERLALSACFRGSPAMTCTTCHRPHQGVAAQGTASFDATCAGCHPCVSDPGLKVEAVTGEPARTAEGCVDCHVRRSQPFDLPHVRSADHFVRRRIPAPRQDIPHRQFADPSGDLEIFDDGRLKRQLATDMGRRWRRGVLAMGLMTLGRTEEAARAFDSVPPPGTPAARAPAAPAGLVAVETWPSFHQLRALSLLATGRSRDARDAYSDALTLDPLAAGALIGRARLRLAAGDVAGALTDTQVVIDNYPRAEQPWQLRAHMAEQLGRADLALAAFAAVTERWPSDPVAWLKLGLLRRQRGDPTARVAFEHARTLQPSLDLKANPSD